jgi:hypothetical protein
MDRRMQPTTPPRRSVGRPQHRGGRQDLDGGDAAGPASIRSGSPWRSLPAHGHSTAPARPSARACSRVTSRGIGVGRQVDAGDRGLLVEQVVDEPSDGWRLRSYYHLLGFAASHTPRHLS